MLALVVPNIICFQTQKQLASFINIRVLLKSVLTDLRARKFLRTKTSLHLRRMHARHRARILSSPDLEILLQHFLAITTDAVARYTSFNYHMDNQDFSFLIDYFILMPPQHQFLRKHLLRPLIPFRLVFKKFVPVFHNGKE